MENEKEENSNIIPILPKHPKDSATDQQPDKCEYKLLSEKEIMDWCPVEFKPYQRQVWLEIASDVNDAGHLISKNLLRIKQVVPIIVIYRGAVEDVSVEGLTWETGSKGRNGNQKKPHALLPTITSYDKQITNFCNAFGLDPASEARLKDPRQGDLGANEGW